MESKRPDRIADLLWKDIADLLLRRVKDPRVQGITITGVKVTQDLQHARVYYCIMGGSGTSKEDAAAGLNKAKGFIRQEIGKRLHIRYLPQLTFEYDTSFEYGDKMERLFKELNVDE